MLGVRNGYQDSVGWVNDQIDSTFKSPWDGVSRSSDPIKFPKLNYRVDESAVAERINAVREKYAQGPYSISKNKNVAVADININGHSDTLISISGEMERPGSVPNPSDRVLGTPIRRASDSERKMLEYLASQLPPGSQGYLTVYSELRVREFCQDAFGRFSEMFPDIDIDVVSGPNAHKVR